MLERNIKKLIQKPQNLGIGSTDALNKDKLPNKVITSKYTFLSFLPHNFFHQLKKGSTFFFFITLILLSFPKISPFKPFTYLFAFIIVVGVSMIKDAIEDYKRHVDDFVLNSAKLDVVNCIEFEDGSIEFLINSKECMELQAGDFVIIKKDQEIAADVVLLRSKAYHRNKLQCTNHCFVQTSNLDGESNLKKRFSIEIPEDFRCCKKIKEDSFADANVSESVTESESRNENTENSSGNIASLESPSGNIATLESPSGNIATLESPSGNIATLESSSGNIASLENSSGNITFLENSSGNIASLESPSSADYLTSPCYSHFFRKIHSFNLKETGDSFENFSCDLNIDGKLMIADTKNVILRGSKLKNTEACLCLVVSVGSNTKLTKSLNKSKRTKTLFDVQMDFILKIVLVLYAVMMTVTILLGMIFFSRNSDLIYLNINNFWSSLLLLIFSNYILYIYLVPLSLYVMLEIARFVHVFYISSDSSMVIQDIPSKCRNANVIEDLAVIDYILTDKTGTITKNLMTLKHMHVHENNGLITPDEFLGALKNLIIKSNNLESKIKNILNENTKDKIHFLFLINMLICNSIEILNHKPEGISQEELCFLEATSKCGFKLIKRDENKAVVEILGKRLSIEILGTREFASKIQRMDVVVRIYGRVFLLAKGSDQKLLNKRKEKEKVEIINKFNDFRSLVMKYKELTEKEENDFLMSITMDLESKDEERTGNDMTMLQEKKQKEDDGFDALEENAKYLGTVFIEDEMQEEVKETMKHLKEAGLRIWMITGDKKETAIACARSACLIESEDFLALSGQDVLKAIEDSIAFEAQNSPGQITQESQTETVNLTNQRTREVNQNLFERKSLVIFRATPSQKGQIATLVVKSGRHTLAIGDGSNDIGMLKASDVGVGVIGKEGTQAAMAGDFAIPQFKLLRNLLFVHGRYCLQRYTSLVLNTYYKNIVFIFLQFIYNLFCGASGRPIYSSIIFNYYNLFFTSMIPFSISVFDKDVSKADALRNPRTYRDVRDSFNCLYIYSNILFAILEATIIFFVARLFLINEISNRTGIITGYSTFSIVFSIGVIFAVILRQVRSISFRVVFTDIAIGSSIFLNVIGILWVQELYSHSKYAIFHLLNSYFFYFTIFSLISVIYVIDTIFVNINLYIAEKLSKNK